MSMNYSYIDAALAKDFLDGNPPVAVAEDGDRLPGTAKDTFSLFVDWQTPLTSSLELNVNANYIYVGSRPNNLGSIRFGPPDSRTIPSHQITNLSASVSHENGVTVSLFANNLFDERTPQVFTAISVIEVVNMNRPRTIGLKAAYQF